MFLTVAIVLALPLGLAGLPPALTDMGFEQAVEANAVAGDRLLIVKFTASWCAPCKVMDRTTWSDEGVIGYLKEHGMTAIPVDIDRHADIARACRISAVPTIVLYRSGVEFDRSVGGMDAAAMRAWLDRAREGKTKAEAVRERAGGEDGGVPMRDRLQQARGLARSRDFERATAEFVWLWNHMLEHEPAMSGVRLSFMASYMQDLARKSEHARDAFTTLRDGLTERLEGEHASREDLTDWLVLCTKVLGDDAAVRAWVDRIWERPTGPQTLRSVGHLMDRWLIEQGEWVKAGVSQFPVGQFMATERAVLQSRHDTDRDPALAAMLKESGERNFIDRFAAYHASCLAAGRDEEAWQAAEGLLLDFPRDDARAALCRDALRAGAVRARHAEIAGQITGAEGERLAGLIERALKSGD